MAHYSGAAYMTVRAGNNAVTSTEAYGYDAVRNLVSVDGPLSGTADTSRTYYDLNRRVTGTASPDPDGAGALRIRASRITYNADNQPTITEIGSIAASDLTIAPASWTTFQALEKTETTYDFGGRAVRATAFGRLVHTDAWTRHGVVDQAYDVAWRPTCSTVRMNPAVFGSLPASACTLSTQGANGADRITHQAYDAVSRPTVTTSAYGTPLAIAEASLGYSPNGQVATITDAGGNRTTRVYDGHDRLSQLRYPSPTTVNTSSTTDYEGYTYHPTNARLASTRLRDATTITYGYDNLGRVTTETPSSNGFATTTAYDNYSRITSLVSNGQTLSYAYDQLSRLTSETQPLGAVSYLYDSAGRRTRLTYPGGLYIGYDVNVVGEVTALRENGAGSGVGVLAQYAYDDLGRRTSLTRGNGTTETYTYDLESRLASLVTNLAATTHDRTLSMSYNEADQIVSRNNTNTLFAWSAPSSNTTYTDNGLNQYTTVGATAQSYDLRGNLTTGGFLYDAYNRLTSGPNSAALVYDPSGRLARTQSASSAATRFLYDGVDLIAEYNASGTLLRRYVHGPGSDEPVVWYEGAGTTDRRWLVRDELGTVVAITNASGAATSVNKYDVYGVPGASNTGRFGFTGQVWLPELGLYHYKARAYSPTLGRFLQTDPIGFAGGMNLYSYVGNNPLNATDPLGLAEFVQSDDIVVVGKRDEDIVVTGKRGGGVNAGMYLANFLTSVRKAQSELWKSLLALTEGCTEGEVCTGAIDPRSSDAGQRGEYHKYVITRPAACSASRAFASVREPGKSAPGAPYAESGIHLRPLPPFEMNPITQSVDVQNLTITNTTKEGHSFHPGAVVISVKENARGGSDIIIEGTGTGKYPLLNIVMGHMLFGGMATGVMQSCDRTSGMSALP